MEVLNVNETAIYLNCSVSAIRKLVTLNQIPYFRIGSRILFRKLALDNWISAQELQHNISTKRRI